MASPAGTAQSEALTERQELQSTGLKTQPEECTTQPMSIEPQSNMQEQSAAESQYAEKPEHVDQSGIQSDPTTQSEAIDQSGIQSDPTTQSEAIEQPDAIIASETTTEPDPEAEHLGSIDNPIEHPAAESDALKAPSDSSLSDFASEDDDDDDYQDNEDGDEEGVDDNNKEEEGGDNDDDKPEEEEEEEEEEEKEVFYNFSGHKTTSKVLAGSPSDAFIHYKAITTTPLHEATEGTYELPEEIYGEAANRKTTYLIVGVVPAGSLARYNKHNPKNPMDKEYVMEDAEHYIAVIPTSGAASVKCYVLVKNEDEEPDIRTTTFEKIFYRAQYSALCPLPQGVTRPTNRGELTKRWRYVMDRIAVGLDPTTDPVQAFAPELAVPDAPRDEASIDSKLVRDIALCVGKLSLTLTVPDRDAPEIDEILARLQAEVPGITDARPIAVSLQQYFELKKHADTDIEDVYDRAEFDAFKAACGTDVLLEDFLVCKYAMRALKTFWRVDLTLFQLVWAKQALRNLNRTVPFSQARTFFELLEHRFTYFSDDIRIENLLFEMEVHRRNGIEEPPTKSETFTIHSMKMILNAIHGSIKAIVDDDVAEAGALEARIGGVVPAGSFDEAWARFSAAPDIDSARKCMVEIARFLQYHGNIRSRSRTAALYMLLDNLDKIIKAIRE
ncbi:hypothetical protein V490_07586 [Pseudogymnoascus sp. VKM F-3557]|nr:hypothetical protein V490_07586 [Pseudogymnoascus sp. VKM F-3557]